MIIKKIKIVLLLIIASMMSISVVTEAADIKTAAYSFVEATGTLSVDSEAGIGTGSFKDFETTDEDRYDVTFNYSNVPWQSESVIPWQNQTGNTIDRSKIKHIVVKDGVKSIGCAIFADLKNVETVEIADSVTEISSYAFARCYNLKSVIIGNGVKHISPYAFYGDYNINTVKMGSGLQSIDDYAFANCTGIKYLELDKNNISFKKVGNGIYGADGKKLFVYEVKNDSAVGNIARGTESLAPLVFAGSNMRSLSVPSSIKAISPGAFRDCVSLENVVFENGSVCTKTEYIDSKYYFNYENMGSFSGCKNLKNVTFRDAFEWLSDTTFLGCDKLEKVYFGKNFKGVHVEKNSRGSKRNTSDILYNEYNNEPLIPGLKEANVSKDCKTFKSVSGVIYSKNGKKLLLYPAKKSNKTFSVPAKTTTICNCAFSDNKKIKTIKMKKVKTVGISAFKGCTGLEKVELSKNIKLKKNVFDWCYSLKKIKNIRNASGAKKAFGRSNYAIFKTSALDKKKNAIKNITERVSANKYFTLTLDTKNKPSWEISSGKNVASISGKSDGARTINLKYRKNGYFKLRIRSGNKKATVKARFGKQKVDGKNIYSLWVN